MFNITKEIILYLNDCFRVKIGLKPIKAMDCDIYVNSICNLRCSYCYLTKFPEQYTNPGLPKKELLKVIKNASKHSRFFVVLGGEPLLRKDLPEILKFAKESGFLGIRLVTNGILLKKRLDCLKYVDSLAISCDPTRLKEYPLEIKKMLRDIKELKGNNKLPFSYLNITFSNSDKIKDLKPFIMFCKKNNFPVYLNPQKYKKKPYWNYIREVYNWAVEILGKDKVLNTKEVINNLNHEYIIQSCIQAGQFYINVKGEIMYPCDEFSSQRIGYASEDNIKKLYRIAKAMYGLYPNEKCKKCESFCHAENSYRFRSPQKLFINFFNKDKTHFFKSLWPKNIILKS
jgi:MoaA/NifB/PqqE/SkfB family radical SAM enzyme